MLTVQADVTDEADVKRYTDAAIKAFGRIDAFFNNAGIEGQVAPLHEQPLEMFDKVMAINVRGAYLGLKHVLPHMYKAGAGSVEAARHGVRVNSIHPSPVNTRMMRSLESGFDPKDAEAAKQMLTSLIPLGRYGEPGDIADLVLFLASDESRFITGVQYRIDGGMGAQ